MKKIWVLLSVILLNTEIANAATVVATVGGKPITDTDITARTELMSRQGNTATDNRHQALQNIIDDTVKLNYAANFGAVPSDRDVDSELARMNLGEMSASMREMARNAMRADIAWQMIIARTIMPTIDVTKEDIQNEKISLEREHGLPLELTMVRLVDVPDSVVKKLTKPKSCDDAVDMAEKLGGTPQKFTALQYEIAPEVREQIAGIGNLTWSDAVDGNVFLVCSSKKTSEYGDLDKVIKQNAMYRQAMFIADQQLKQLRRKAVVVINDNRYKL
ncbi:MAG: hypothetical protein J5611_03440 [Alphaproteobacteria bacterium]|nr:hypothetical protein [Alphaproteobacteria bacterium]